MATVSFTQLARQDLQNIKDHISLDKPKTGTHYMRHLKQKLDVLAQSPTLGVQRKEYCGLNKFPVENYLIFYRITASGIEVIRILHGSRDIQSILNP